MALVVVVAADLRTDDGAEMVLVCGLMFRGHYLSFGWCGMQRVSVLDINHVGTC